MSANGHVQISDFSDREILLMILDLGGEVSTRDLATRIYGWGPMVEPADRIHGHRCVSSRMSWMWRFGLVVKEEPGVYAASVPGKSMVSVDLGRVTETALARASDTAGLVLANRLGEKLVKAGEITGTAMRRELQFQIERRRRAQR